MAWVSVHQSIAGHKLRGLCKGIGCSECEAMGILLKLWLWALDNADKSGELLNADMGDVARIYVGSTTIKLSPEKIVNFLISEAWIDHADGHLYIHDWPEWQKYWFDFQERKEKDRARKRRGNSEEEDRENPQKLRGNSEEIPAQTATASKQHLNLIEADLNKGNDEVNALCPTGQTTRDAVQEIIAFLNLTLGSNYKATSKKTREHINARLREGFTVDDFKAVILKKHAEWSHDPRMSAYLRPETLFGTKFEGYLNQPGLVSKNPFLDIARREAQNYE